METLSKTIQAYRCRTTGKPTSLQFTTVDRFIGGAGNFETVQQMARNEHPPAQRALERLLPMTSRQRSQSGIYWKLRTEHPNQWTKATEQLLGVPPNKPITMTFSAEVPRSSKSRLEAFHAMCYPHVNDGTTVDVPYVKELMTINVKIN